MGDRTKNNHGYQNIVKKFEKLEKKFLSEIKASRYKITLGQEDPIGAFRYERNDKQPDKKSELLPATKIFTTSDAQKQLSIEQVVGSAKDLTHHLRENDAISESNLRDLEEKVIQLEKALKERLRLQALRKERISLLTTNSMDERQIVSKTDDIPSSSSKLMENKKPKTECAKYLPSPCNLNSRKNVDLIYKNEATGKTFAIKCQSCLSGDGRSKEPKLKIRVNRVTNDDRLIRIRLLKNGKRIMITPKC